MRVADGQVPLDSDGHGHVDGTGEGDRGHWIEEGGVEVGEDVAAVVEDAGRVDRDAAHDEQEVVAGQDDQQVIERVLSHVPEI